MGVEKSVSVFFGTWVDKKSDAGKKLAALIDAHGGTPAPTPIRDVELGLVGSQWSGDIQITIHLSKSWIDSSSLEDSHPKRIGVYREMPKGAPPQPILDFLRSMGIDEGDAQPIGWHFAMSVW